MKLTSGINSGFEVLAGALWIPIVIPLVDVITTQNQRWRRECSPNHNECFRCGASTNPQLQPEDLQVQRIVVRGVIAYTVPVRMACTLT